VTAAEFLATDTVVPWPRREPETVLSRPFTQAHIAVGTHGCGVPDGHGFRGGGGVTNRMPVHHRRFRPESLPDHDPGNPSRVRAMPSLGNVALDGARTGRILYLTTIHLRRSQRRYAGDLHSV